MPKEYEKPVGASWPVWKIMLIGFATSVLYIFLIWLFNSMLNQFNTGVYIHPLTIHEILLGSGWLVLALWSRWAWRPRRKHARWHRWVQALGGVLYFSVLMLLLPITYWNALLKYPWNWVVNGVLIVLFTLAWILPVISYPMAKKLARMQWAFNFRILLYGGLSGLMVLAGILGASFGMNASRNGEVGSAILVVAFLFSPIALAVAQMGGESAWSRRPWQKEDEE